MRVFLNTLYTSLLFLLVYFSFAFIGSKGFIDGFDLYGQPDYVSEAIDVEAYDNMAIMPSCLLFLAPLVLQVARLKFELKLTNALVLSASWILQLCILLFMIGGHRVGLTFRGNVTFARWLLCFLAVVPAFALMYWERYVVFRSGSIQNSQNVAANLHAEGTPAS